MRIWLIAAIAAVLLFTGLDRKLLWEDEANTAVLATRLLHFGKPLAYDGRNFVGLDDSSMEDLEPIEQRTGSARAEIDFYLRHKFIKPDMTWKWHPWGSFLMAAASIGVLGQTTFAARLPFAIAGLLTVLLLYRLIVSAGYARRMAEIAAVLLTFNGYWILHERQCRYYAPSCLMLVATLFAYTRWQRSARWGRTSFIAAAWCWFQMDYGTFWPVLGVLAADALIAHWRKPWLTLGVGAALAGTIAPFVWYYELWGRRGIQEDTWWERFQMNLFNGNEFVLPVLILIIAAVFLARHWDRTAGLAFGIVTALIFWVPSTAPDAFLRYIIVAAPAGCLVTAWVVTRLVPERAGLLVTALLIVTPWASLPLHLAVETPFWHPQWMLVRSELARMRQDVFGDTHDVNGPPIEWLKANAAPSDEILVNYEDLPLMYYLPNPIRGGIAAFRVEDDSHGPPRYLLLRPDIPFIDEDSFARERARYRWVRIPMEDRSALWGNNPDPMSEIGEPRTASVVLMRRVD